MVSVGDVVWVVVDYYSENWWIVELDQRCLECDIEFYFCKQVLQGFIEMSLRSVGGMSSSVYWKCIVVKYFEKWKMVCF